MLNFCTCCKGFGLTHVQTTDARKQAHAQLSQVLSRIRAGVRPFDQLAVLAVRAKVYSPTVVMTSEGFHVAHAFGAVVS